MCVRNVLPLTHGQGLYHQCVRVCLFRQGLRGRRGDPHLLAAGWSVGQTATRGRINQHTGHDIKYHQSQSLGIKLSLRSTELGKSDFSELHTVRGKRK